MAREQITWHTEPNDSSVLPLLSSTHSIASLSYLLLYFFVVVLLRFSLAFLVLAHVRNCPESMWNVKKIFLQFSRRRRKWTTIMRISSESSVWSEFVTSQTRVQSRERERERVGDRDNSESRRPTQCAAVSCNSVAATLPTVTAHRRTCFNWIRRKLHLNAVACRRLQHVRGKRTGSCVVWKREKGKRAYTDKAGQH